MIVVGIDGSDGSRRALEFASNEATVRQCGLRIVSVWHVPPPIYSAGMRVPAVPGTESEDSMRAAVEREAATVAEHHPEVVSELIVCEGNAASELVDKSNGVDMLVVGSRGLGGFRGLLLGSVSQQCAQHAHCPVVIVPAEERS